MSLGGRAVSILTEFRDFAVRGNVVDLAVGVIIGSAFGALVGGIDYKEFFVTIGGAKIMYGLFIQNCVDFVIIAASIFLAVRLINHFRRKAEKEPPAAPPPRQEKLLEEIRDLLKEKR
jgi:large conductance mechanosensitive channel